MLRGMQMTAAASGTVALGVLVGMLGMACGGSAGDRREESSTEATLPLAPTASSASVPRPSGAADDAASSTSAPEEGAMAAAPSIPLVPSPSEPAEEQPLPSTELDTTRSLGTLAPTEVVIEPGDCRFEFLGDWVRCENAGWPNVALTDASDLVSCMQRCLEVDGCTAVTDYLWLGLPGLGCYLYLSTCDEPAFASDWGEEDGGRDFRRSCSGSSAEAPAP
jgi:hypothetical protein